jgi:epoxyqueuosine reductase
MSLTEELKRYLKDTVEVDYVGVSPVERLAGAPEGYRPTDFLPGAKNVVVMAVKLPNGAVQAIYRAHEDKKRYMLCMYGTHGHMFTPNTHLNFAAYRAARFLERYGHISAPLPSGPGGGGAPFSHRHAMVAAGIGELGLNHIVLTPDYGPRVRAVSVITQADLEPDPLYSGPKICDRAKCGDICVKICPSHALDPVKTNKVVIGGRTYEYGYIHPDRCRVSAEALTKKTLGHVDQELPLDPTPEEISAARKRIAPFAMMDSVAALGAGYFCAFCLAYCPVGGKDWQKKVSKRVAEDRLH